MKLFDLCVLFVICLVPYLLSILSTFYYCMLSVYVTECATTSCRYVVSTPLSAMCNEWYRTVLVTVVLFTLVLLSLGFTVPTFE